MRSAKLSRREFLAISAVMLEAGFAGWPLAAGAVELGGLSEKLGTYYLSLNPNENSLPWLKSELHFAKNASESDIKSALRTDIVEDFENERTFRYAGWVFSRTEGRLCAYKALVVA